jgi:UrcA family protein
MGRQEAEMKSGLMAICAASILGGTAVAQPPIIVTMEPVPTERVSYADLNLASASGQARLEARIRSAAEHVCFLTNDRSLDKYMPERRCFTTAYNGGVSQMNSLVAAQGSNPSLAAAAITVSGH